jgi:hypothetical protein
MRSYRRTKKEINGKFLKWGSDDPKMKNYVSKIIYTTNFSLEYACTVNSESFKVQMDLKYNYLFHNH